MGRITLSEVEDDLMPGEDDLSDSVTDNSELEGEKRERDEYKILTGPEEYFQNAPSSICTNHLI